MSLPVSPVAVLAAVSTTHHSPHRLKKSKTELPPPPTKVTTPRLTHSPLSPALTTTVSSPLATPRLADIECLDEQLSAITLRDSSILTLCDTLAAAEEDASRERRAALVRDIKDKLIGSESNKALCLHFKHHCTLIAMLTHSLEADEADEAQLRLQLITALSSLSMYGEAAQQQLQRDGMVQVLFECVRSGQQPLVDAAVGALGPLLSSTSAASSQRSSAVVSAMSHVDLVIHLIACLRHWQPHTSDAAATALTIMATGSLSRQLCLIMHGILPAIMSHLATYKPWSHSQPVSAPFVASLRLLSALCHQNIYLVTSLLLPASHPHSLATLLVNPFANAAASLLPLAASLLLHPNPYIRLHAATFIVHCTLVECSLQRCTRDDLTAEDAAVRDSPLLRLHREWTASPMSKRGRAGNAKGGQRRQSSNAGNETFSVQQWIGALQPTLAACTTAAASTSTSLLAPAIAVLTSLQPRVCKVLVRLTESDVAEVVVEAADALSKLLESLPHIDGGLSDLVDQLATITLARLTRFSASASHAPRGGMPDVRPALLRLLYQLCKHERQRRLVLYDHMHLCSVVDLCSSPSLNVQCAAMGVMGQLAQSYCAHQALTAPYSAGKFRSFVVLVLSRLTDDDIRVSEAAHSLVSCLLRPHGFRSMVAELSKGELLSTLLRWTKDCHGEEQSSADEDELSTLWRRHSLRRHRTIHALMAISCLASRCDTDMQRRVIDGFGGWNQLLLTLQNRAQSDKQAVDTGLLCATLVVIGQVVGAAQRHETDDVMEDWTNAKPYQPEAKRAVTEPMLSTGEISSLLTSLTPLLCSATPTVVLSSLLRVVVNVSCHPRASAALLLSSPTYSTAVLQCVLRGLRHLHTEQRELAVLVLYNAMLLVVNDRQQRKGNNNTAADDSSELPIGRQTNGTTRNRGAIGKRRRSTDRPNSNSTTARRTRRRADNNSTETQKRDSEESAEADADIDTSTTSTAAVDSNEVTYLVLLSTTGVIAELMRMVDSEVDGAVLGRVKRVLLLLRMTAAVTHSSSNTPLLMQLRALEIDVEEDAGSGTLDGDGDGDEDGEEEDEEQQVRGMEDVQLRGADDESKEAETGNNMRVRWRSTVSGAAQLSRTAWLNSGRMARTRTSTHTRDVGETDERRRATTPHEHAEDSDEKQYDLHSPLSAEDDTHDRSGRAENRLLRQYVREWMAQPHAPRPSDDSVFGRLLALVEAPSPPPAASSSSSSFTSSSSSSSSSGASAGSSRHPLQSPYPFHNRSGMSSALDRPSRHMQALAATMASAIQARVDEERRNTQASSTRRPRNLRGDLLR